MNPTVLLSSPQEQCLTFFWDEMPEYYIGYRFVEGQPMISDRPIAGSEKQPVANHSTLPEAISLQKLHSKNPGWHDNWQVTYSEKNGLAPYQLSFEGFEDGTAKCTYSENEGKQRHEILLHPFEYGIRMVHRLTTLESLTGSYCLQQCLRFTGTINDPWRKTVAHIPFLSELDMQAMGNPNGTITYARQNNQWVNFPVPYTKYQTNTNDQTQDKLEAEFVDHGLIVRETPSRDYAPASYWERVAPKANWEQITCGMYWERTAYVSNRHPADCVHSWVDFGPLSMGQTRTVFGVVYFIEGSKDDLLALWQREHQTN